MGERRYLYLSTEVSSSQLRYVNTNEIPIELSSNVELTGEWECSLIELHMKLKIAYTYGEHIDVISEIVEGTSTNIGCQSLLRRVFSDSPSLKRIHYTDLPSRFVRMKLLNLHRIPFRLIEYANTQKIDTSFPIFFVLELRKKR